MTVFTITGPDGKKYRVTGDTPAGAVAALKKMLAGKSAPAPERPTPAPLSPEVAARQAQIDAMAGQNMEKGASGAFMGNLAQGASFGFADNIAAGIGSMVEDRSYGEILGGLRQQRQMDEQMYPRATMAGDVAGAVAGSAIGLAATAPKALTMIPTTTAGRAVVGTAAGAGAGAIEGGVAAVGYDDGANPLGAAAGGAKVGAVLGGAIGGAAPFVAKGFKDLALWAKGYDVKTIARTLGVSSKTAEVIKAGLSGDDPAKALSRLTRAGPDAMLADAGPGMSQLLDTAMQTSGPAARLAGNAIEARAAKAAGRISSVFDGLLGKADAGIKTAARGIAEKSSAIRRAAYDRAFAMPVDYASDAGRAIEDVVARIPSAMLNKAVSVANDAMKIDGRQNFQIMASIGADGSVTFTQPLNVFQLNEIKKALGEIGRGAVDQFGRLTGEGLRVKRLEVEMAKAMGEAVPAYRTAVKLGGDKIAEDQALDLGRKMLSPTVTREMVTDGLANASRDALAAARRGLRVFIDEAMANVGRVVTDANVDAREAMAVIKGLSSRAAREKIGILLPGRRAEVLADALEEAAAHLELRSAVARNSATAARTATRETVERIVGDTALDAVMDGRPVNAAQRVISALTGGSGPGKAAALNQIYTEVAKALTGPRGAQARVAMRVIEGAMNGQPIKTQEAETIARLLTSGAALLSYQSGKRHLETRLGAR